MITESLYNNGRGIQISMSLIGLLPPVKTGSKPQVNVKPPTTTTIVYIHKEMHFINVIYVIVGHALNWWDLCKTGGLDHYDCLIHGEPRRGGFSTLQRWYVKYMTLNGNFCKVSIFSRLWSKINPLFNVVIINTYGWNLNQQKVVEKKVN